MRDIDEQRACPADEVRPDSAGGQLHQMRQSMKFTDDDFGGLARRIPGPGPDAATAAKARTRGAPD